MYFIIISHCEIQHVNLCHICFLLQLLDWCIIKNIIMLHKVCLASAQVTEMSSCILVEELSRINLQCHSNSKWSVQELYYKVKMTAGDQSKSS